MFGRFTCNQMCFSLDFHIDLISLLSCFASSTIYYATKCFTLGIIVFVCVSYNFGRKSLHSDVIDFFLSSCCFQMRVVKCYVNSILRVWGVFVMIFCHKIAKQRDCSNNISFTLLLQFCSNLFYGLEDFLYSDLLYIEDSRSLGSTEKSQVSLKRFSQ